LNTPALVASLIMAAVLALLVFVVIRAMMRGWLRRARRQADLIGELPAVPDDPGPVTVAAMPGLYVGSTLALPAAARPSSSPPATAPASSSAPATAPASSSPPRPGVPGACGGDRIVFGDLGYPANAVLSRHTNGILLLRSGASTLWIPRTAIIGIRSQRGIAGKVSRRDGVLAIRWRLPSGTEIDTGFRGNDRRKYAQWVDSS
jgi:hypothetical protein